MTRGLFTRSIYSPGNLTPEALEALFVGRDKMLADVLKRLSHSFRRKEKHFFLLVGPRGIGKTHFVALAYHRLTHVERYQKARERAVIAYLSEEEWGIASFLDLLLRILNALLNCLDPDTRPARATLDAIYEIYQRDAHAAERVARHELTRIIGNKTLLLICENLQDVFHGLGTEGQQRWRAFIQEHPFWTILATTPKLFSGVQLRESPFYGFFTIRRLETLDFEGALSLLRQRARFENNTGLAEFLDTPTGRARVRAIHHLAGGNHRVYVVMAEFLDHESLDELIDPFMRMVDDLTPYYQEKMRQLSPQQRKIIEFLAREMHPVMVKQIAIRSLMTQQTAAKQISQLADYGFVDRHKAGRETYCELAEPLMRICVEIKDTRTKHIRLFVDFLRHWYSSREIKRRLDALHPEQSVVHRFDVLHLDAALHECRQDHREPFLDALSDEEWRCLAVGDHAGLAEASGRLAAERGLPQHYCNHIYALRELHRHEEALRVALEAAAKYPQDAPVLAELAWAYAEMGNYEESLGAIDRAIEQDPDRVSYRCFRGTFLLSAGRHEDVLQNEDALLAIEPHHYHSFVAKTWALMGLGRYEDALALRALVPSDNLEYHRMRTLESHCLLRLKRYQECIQVCDEVSSECSTHWDLHLNKAAALRSLSLNDDAVISIMHLVDAEDDALSEVLSGIRQLVEMHRFANARELVTHALTLDATDLDALSLQVLVDSGERGFAEGCKAVAVCLQHELPEESLVFVIRDMLLLEDELRGAVAIARQIGQLDSLMAKFGARASLVAALNMFISTHHAAYGFGKPDWPVAVSIFEEALGEMEEFGLVLKVMSVAVRYAATSDETVLLELPLELRSLIASRDE